MFGENWNINKQENKAFKLILAGKNPQLFPLSSLYLLTSGTDDNLTFPQRLKSCIPEYKLSLKNYNLESGVHIHVNRMQVLFFPSAYRQPETINVTNKTPQLYQLIATLNVNDEDLLSVFSLLIPAQ